MKITGTFLDEISHDIPHQNWGRKEWDADFRQMRAIGIDTVILIRCGHRRWMTYPSAVLARKEQGYLPPVDLVDLFLDLAERYQMKFFMGTYDSGHYWHEGEAARERDINCAVIDEIWEKYGHRKAFQGWYLTQEVSRVRSGIVDVYAQIGRHCKEISGRLPVMISPFIDGAKSVSAFKSDLLRDTRAISVDEHVKEWNDILSGICGTVDILAFQDGHCDYSELQDFMSANRELADLYRMECWTNCESFDRDMPIKFLPIKWEKMLLKLKAAEAAGISKAITFEFSHFMSPNSCYRAAGHLFNRYCEYFGLPGSFDQSRPE